MSELVFSKWLNFSKSKFPLSFLSITVFPLDRFFLLTITASLFVMSSVVVEYLVVTQFLPLMVINKKKLNAYKKTWFADDPDWRLVSDDIIPKDSGQMTAFGTIVCIKFWVWGFDSAQHRSMYECMKLNLGQEQFPFLLRSIMSLILHLWVIGLSEWYYESTYDMTGT